MSFNKGSLPSWLSLDICAIFPVEIIAASSLFSNSIIQPDKMCFLLLPFSSSADNSLSLFIFLGLLLHHKCCLDRFHQSLKSPIETDKVKLNLGVKISPALRNSISRRLRWPPPPEWPLPMAKYEMARNKIIFIFMMVP